jgi:putative ABC transport system permease protein
VTALAIRGVPEGLVARLQALGTHLVFSGRIAAEAVGHNTLRAGLTALGILFGVASVIAMLAIGNGAEREVLEQMQLLGANTIVITPVVAPTDGAGDGTSGSMGSGTAGKASPTPFTPGLTALDAAAITGEITNVTATSSEVVLTRAITREGRDHAGTLVGVDSSYFRVMHLPLSEGAGFTARHFQTVGPVAIIGQGVKGRFFTTADPIGQPLKVGTTWLTVVGVLAGRRTVAAATAKRLGIRDANMDVYVPLPTMLLRYRNRGAVTETDLQAAQASTRSAIDSSASDATRADRRNYNQLDELIIQVDQSAFVAPVAALVRRILQRRHNGVADFQVTVPELLLQQEEDTKRIFNIVLGAIASISLVVGGIGIMNIMLASILERTKEIGVRRAMGATRKDVLGQFLLEAVMISLAGGIAGILLGALLSVTIARLAHITTIISPLSVAVAFGVSVAVGLVFGLMPARTAARQDPIVCLRYE